MRRLTPLVLCLALAACDGATIPRAEHTRGEREGQQVLAFTPYADFVAEGALRVSPPIVVEEGVDRVSVIAGVSEPVTVQVRVDGGAWQPMRGVWAFEGYSVHVAAAVGAQVQIGLAEADVARVGWLRASASHDRQPPFEARAESGGAALDPGLAGIGVLPRDAWNAQPSRCSDVERHEGFDRFSIHGALSPVDGSPAVALATQVHETIGLGFCDVGYHFLVGPDGRIWEGRSLDLESGHAGDADPTGNVAIGFVGCFDSEHCGPHLAAPTDAALDAAAELLAHLGARHGVPVGPGTVRGFQGCARPSTDCASDLLLASIDDLIRRAQGPTVAGDAGMPGEEDAGHSHDHDAGGPLPPPPECGETGCDWCASTGSCRMGGACAWAGDVAGERCWSAFDPCTTASCWEPTLSIPACTSASAPEDFSSGRYTVHRYAATLPSGAPVTMRLRRVAGGFEPAMIITDAAGALIWGGDAASLYAGVTVSAAVSGRGASEASVTLVASAPLDVRVHVTGWSVVDAGFAASLPTDVRYALDSTQTCMSMPPGPSRSESVGSPTSGSLSNGVRITPHPGYVVADTGRNAYWGTQETVDLIRSGFDAVAAAHPGAQIVQVRDISIDGGGPPGSGPWPHSSHESGRDADLTYHLSSCDPGRGCPLADAPLSTFDAAATWTLFHHWIQQGVVTYIFVDHALQRLLYEEAMRRGATASQLERWIQYPRATSVREGIVRHVSNHRNHHHVRFRCPTDDARCVE